MNLYSIFSTSFPTFVPDSSVSPSLLYPSTSPPTAPLQGGFALADCLNNPLSQRKQQDAFNDDSNPLKFVKCVVIEEVTRSDGRTRFVVSQSVGNHGLGTIRVDGLLETDSGPTRETTSEGCKKCVVCGCEFGEGVRVTVHVCGYVTLFYNQLICVAKNTIILRV